MDDLDNIDEQLKKTKRGKSHSPDRDTAAASKRQWDATYDKGKGTNAEAANTADEIFQKFGIAFSFGKDEEEAANNMEKQGGEKPDESEPLAGQYDNTNFIVEEDGSDFFDHVSGFESSLRDDMSDSYACSDLSSQWTSTASSTGSRKKKKNKSSQKSEAELSLIDDNPLDYSSDYGGGQLSPVYVGEHNAVYGGGQVSPIYVEDHSTKYGGGQVSPIYVEELGESTTDPDPRDSCASSRFTYSDIEVQPGSPSVLGDNMSMTEYSNPRNSVICTQPSATASTPVTEQPLGDLHLQGDLVSVSYISDLTSIQFVHFNILQHLHNMIYIKNVMTNCNEKPQCFKV